MNVQAPFQTVATKKMIKERSESQKLAWTLCIIFIVFVACWTPHIVLSVSFFTNYRQLPIPRVFNVILKIFHLLCWQINRKLILKSNTSQITKVLYQKPRICLNVCITGCLSVKTIYTIFIFSSVVYFSVIWVRGQNWATVISASNLLCIVCLIYWQYSVRNVL